MRSLLVVCMRFLSICLVLVTVVAGSILPVFAEDASTSTKPEEPAFAQLSLADVVYESGALSQRLSGLKNRPDNTRNLQRLEQRLKLAGAEADSFLSRLNVLQDDDLQSYQQLAVLKGEVLSENEVVRRTVASLTEAIREIEARRRTWLTEKKRWERWRS